MSLIYLYLGEEKYRINSKIDVIVRESGVDDYNLTTYDLDDEFLSDAIQDALMPPFLTEKKVVILKNPKFLGSEKSLTDEEARLFIKYITRPMESTILIINASNIKLDERKEVVKKLKAHADISENKELSEIELIGWLKRQCALNNVDIKDDAIKHFYQVAGKNLFNAKNEIDKLICYVGPNGVITTDIINKVVVKEIQNDVFALSNSIIEQNKSKIINLYRDLIKLGNDVNYLFSLVSKSMREILLVNLMLQKGCKQSDVASLMKVSSGKAFYLVKNARSIDIEKVKSYIIKLGNLDYKIKSGVLDPKTGFEFFLFEL